MRKGIAVVVVVVDVVMSCVVWRRENNKPPSLPASHNSVAQSNSSRGCKPHEPAMLPYIKPFSTTPFDCGILPSCVYMASGGASEWSQWPWWWFGGVFLRALFACEKRSHARALGVSVFVSMDVLFGLCTTAALVYCIYDEYRM